MHGNGQSNPVRKSALVRDPVNDVIDFELLSRWHGGWQRLYSEKRFWVAPAGFARVGLPFASTPSVPPCISYLIIVTVCDILRLESTPPMR
jgi:hypothetical protein